MSGASALRSRPWAELFASARDRLGSETEARWLVEEVSGYPWPQLAVDPALEPSERARSRLEGLIERRLAGEPLQYVLGRWPFRTLDLMVDARVLIPRPETEQVVEYALNELGRLDAAAGERSSSHPRRSRSHLTVVDLGTGSGAIALSIAAERPNTTVYATDASRSALEVAAANLAGFGGRAATRVTLAEGSWWSALPEQLRGGIDLVVSNPPYIASREVAHLEPGVRDWEPVAALESGATGLEAMEQILAGAAGGWLRRGGTAVIEIAPDQSEAAMRTATAAGFSDVSVGRDLAGRDRALIARGAP